METWEVWDIEKKLEGKLDPFSPLHSSHESKDEFFVSADRSSNGSGISAQLNVSKREFELSEEGDLLSPPSSCSPASRRTSHSGSRMRMNSLSSYEDSIGLTTSYTLEEPGKEKRHVLVMDGLRSRTSRDESTCNEHLSTTHNGERNRISGEHGKGNSDSVFCEDSLNCEHQSNDIGDCQCDNINRRKGNNSCTNERCDTDRHGRGNCDHLRKNSNITGNGCDSEYFNKSFKTETVIDLTSSSEESNCSITKSYTLDEPGKEQRHVYVVQASRSSTNLNDTSPNCSSEREEEPNMKKELSKSLDIIHGANDNNDNKNVISEQANGSAGSPPRKKKNKSLFAKAKKFLKSPLLKASSTLSKFDKSDSRSRGNSTSEEGKNSLKNGTIGKRNEEEKHLLVVPRPSQTSSSDSSPTSSGENSPKMRTKKTSDKEGKSPFEKKFSRFSSKKKKSDSKLGTDTLSSNMVDKNDSEDEYDIISIVHHKTKPETDYFAVPRDQDEDDSTPNIEYDISFKPENTSEKNDQAELPSTPMTPLQKGLMSLVVGVGLGEEEERKNVVANIVRPHCVEEHGRFTLGHGGGSNTLPRTRSRRNTDILSPLNAKSGLLHTSGLLFGRSIKNIQRNMDTNDTKKAEENSTPLSEKVFKSEDNFIDDIVEEEDFDIHPLSTSTPIKGELDRVTDKYSVSNGDYDNNNTIESEEDILNVVHTTDEKTLKNTNHVRNLIFDSDISSISSISSSDMYTSSDDTDSPSIFSPNITSEGYSEDYDVTGTEQISSMSEDSLAVPDLDVLVKHLQILGDAEEKVITNEVDQDEDSLSRKLSTDSLTSFEYHEREFTSQSISPLYPLSPTANRSPKRSISDEIPEPPVVVADTILAEPIDYDEWYIGAGMEDMSERRMTMDLLNYMPPIEEDSESAYLTEEEQAVEPAAISPRECDQERKKPLEKALDSPRSLRENDGGGKQDVDPTLRIEQVNLEMGAEVSKLATKIKKGSSRKNLKSKKKKEKQRTEDEGEASQPSTPEKIWVYEPKIIDEYVNLGENEKALQQQVEAGIDSPEFDIVHVYKEDLDVSLKNDQQVEANTCAQPCKYEDQSCQTDILNDVDASSTNHNNQQSNISPENLDDKEVNSADTADNNIHCGDTEESFNVDEKSFEDLAVQTESGLDEALVALEDTRASFEHGPVRPIRRSRSYGPSSSNNDIDLNNLIDSIMENNNEVIESMKSNDYLNLSSDKSLKLKTKTKKKSENKTEDVTVSEEEIHVEEQLPLEIAPIDFDNISIGSSSSDEESSYNTMPVKTCDEETKSKDDEQFDMLPELIVTQASIESVELDSGVEHTEFLSKMDVIRLEDEEDEEEGDSGTELRYDEFLTNESSSGPDYDYHKWVEKIKPLLYDAELVANLYIRLSNKYAKYITKNEAAVEMHLQHLHSAQIAYDVIKESNLTNFASVITYLLSYLGAIKSEKPIPENVSVPNLLSFLEEIIKRNTMTSHHVTMLTCFISRPNRKLTAHHELRLRCLHTCFKQEISQLNINTEELRYLRTCFIKICEYFVQLDMKLTKNVTNEYLLPHITDKNSTSFIMDALTYMGLVKSEEAVVTTNDITSPLILLDIIFLSRQMSLLTSQKLYAFIQLNNPRFRFCATEREAVAKTLRKAIDF